MILGTLKYPSRYKGLGCRITRALEFLAGLGDLICLPVGRVLIDGMSLYMDVVESKTVAHDAKLFEAHRFYTDIHVTLSGDEWYGCAPLINLKHEKPYSIEEDIEYYSGKGVYFQVPSGQFVIFQNNEAHKPLVTFSDENFVKKLVIKARECEC